MKKIKILIIGGGFAGVFTAKNLLKKLTKDIKKNTTIEMINANNYFIFQPLLPEVSSGIINPHDAVTPLRVLLPKIKHRVATLQNIDIKNNMVTVLQGRHKKFIKIQYDQLIIACGQKSNMNLRGFAEHSFTMKNLSDAFLLRNHTLKCLELADVTLDKMLKKRSLTFVVAGAGFSGVETIGELQDMVRRVLKYYPNIKLTETRFILLQHGNRILEQLPASLAQYAHNKMQKRGIEIMLNIRVISASSDYVQTSENKKIETLTIITTIGSAPLDVITDNFELERGKIIVNKYMQVAKHDNIWALGDAALIPIKKGNNMTYAPPTAQFAVREAKILAHNIAQHLLDKPKKLFTFNPIGMMASLGSYQGVVQIYNLRLSGILAWSIWRGIYITKVPGNIAKIRITLNWIMDYFFPRTLVEISPPESRSIKYASFSKGDIICEKKEVAGYFYFIITGSVLCENNQNSKILKSQQYFGDNINTCEHASQITALEDTKILTMPTQQFALLRHDFKKFNNIFTENK